MMAANRHAIDTERFALDPLTHDQAQLLADLGADPEVVKTLVFDWSEPSKRLEIARFWISHNQEYGIWGVFDRQGTFGGPGRMIGFCAADEPLPGIGKGPEIYYAFDRKTWGCGVATEVVKAVVDHLFVCRGVEAVEALVWAGLNPASDRLLTRLGMSLIGRYPVAEYVGDACLETIDYELWRVRNASPEHSRRCLEEATFKIGQFVGDGAASEKDMSGALYEAAVISGVLARAGEGAVKTTIERMIKAGIAEKGWLHYRVERGSPNR